MGLHRGIEARRYESLGTISEAACRRLLSASQWFMSLPNAKYCLWRCPKLLLHCSTSSESRISSFGSGSFMSETPPRYCSVSTSLQIQFFSVYKVICPHTANRQWWNEQVIATRNPLFTNGKDRKYRGGIMVSNWANGHSLLIKSQSLGMITYGFHLCSLDSYLPVPSHPSFFVKVSTYLKQSSLISLLPARKLMGNPRSTFWFYTGNILSVQADSMYIVLSKTIGILQISLIFSSLDKSHTHKSY